MLSVFVLEGCSRAISTVFTGFLPSFSFPLCSLLGSRVDVRIVTGFRQSYRTLFSLFFISHNE